MAGANQAVELSQLPVGHLEALRSQLEEVRGKLSLLSSDLLYHQQKFAESKENVKKLSKNEQGRFFNRYSDAAEVL